MELPVGISADAFLSSDAITMGTDGKYSHLMDATRAQPGSSFRNEIFVRTLLSDTSVPEVN